MQGTAGCAAAATLRAFGSNVAGRAAAVPPGGPSGWPAGLVATESLTVLRHAPHRSTSETAPREYTHASRSRGTRLCNMTVSFNSLAPCFPRISDSLFLSTPDGLRVVSNRTVPGQSVKFDHFSYKRGGNLFLGCI